MNRLREMGGAECIAACKTLAEEMVWIFKAQGVHQEALAALRLFCEAEVLEGESFLLMGGRTPRGAGPGPIRG